MAARNPSPARRRPPVSRTAPRQDGERSMPKARAGTLAAALEQWFGQEGLDYPWRRSRDPYAVLVSEVMLQQTQIATVLEGGYYQRWMQRFDGFAALAAAEEQEVLSLWQGLGYYRRARHLKRLAEVLMRDHGGCFPDDLSQILKLPGVGRYTAGAVASFCFGQRAALVDGNVARVLSRVQNSALSVDSPQGERQLWQWAGDLVEAAQDPRALNSALMELGQRLCRPKQVHCESCPLHRSCRAEQPLSLPLKMAKRSVTALREDVAWVQRRGRLLLEQELGSRRTGLWKLPQLEQAPSSPPLWTGTYAITRYRVALSVHKMSGLGDLPALQREGRVLQWFASEELDLLPIASPYRRALRALSSELP